MCFFSVLLLLLSILILANAQRNWRKVYLEDPKRILSGYRRSTDIVAEFTDLGYEYETGSIWPKPRTEMRSESVFYTINPKTFNFSATVSNAVLKNALGRYQELTFPEKGLRPEYDLEKIETLEVIVAEIDQPLSQESNESYTLRIKAPKTTLKAKSVWGALRGLETFSQAVYQNGSSYWVAENKITDYPRFYYRGFLIDTSRHYLPVAKIFQFLDAMAYSKFNVLHWHIVDDPSFPYVSKKFPQLHKNGAFNAKTHIYTPEDVQDIIEYAKLRGIRVMPEFDTPGHTHSWGGIPGLLTDCGETGQQEEMFNDMKGPINPILEGSYEFLEEFFKEITEVFPDEYLHLGGDEVDFKCWMSNKRIMQWLQDKGNGGNGTTLHTHYLQKLIKIIEKLKKKYIVWQEVFDDGVQINNRTIVNVWKEGWKQEMSKVTSSGHKAILSSCWYLNYIKYGLDWPKLYKCDPEDFDGTIEQKKLVIGGSAAIWGEYVDATNVIPRSFGRAFAVSERLWSSKDVKDVKSALKRLWEHQCRYIQRGIPAEPVTRSRFCRKEWNSGA
ncbi:beta-hexosaminidase subunit alpha-like [Hydractinia symbiolongicarpus]|uniref:beta-hexosaminidase subunit alpha-like n=1 Tax=Hydractinia symbiolongicarpus TaxID=13093 RepID=UPI00254F2BFC|nr:beta-hexosaminidase subunit alpha-like [Hydractinia symbiolongicarpus]